MTSFILISIGLFIASFLLGSISWGVVISRCFYKVDLREHGSGNIGATNAVRVLGKAGYLVFVLDFGKGVVSGLLAYLLCGLVSSDCGMLSWEILAALYGFALLGCMWGHVFNPWLHFKGGKGIAVAAGCMTFAFGLWGFLAEIGIFLIVVIATRYVSAGSIAAAILCPIVSFVLYVVCAPAGCDPSWINVLCSLIVGATAIWAHRENISRLRKGTESKFGSKKERISHK